MGKRFENEFNDDLAVIAHAVKNFGLPATLKLEVHSGSDKFSIYPVIGNLKSSDPSVALSVWLPSASLVWT